MKFCTKCGVQLEKDSPFCTECGTKILEHEQSKTRSKSGNNSRSLSSLSLKAKIIGASVLTVILLVFGLYKVGESLTDKNKLLNKFVEAIEMEDVDYLLSNLEAADEKYGELTEENISQFLEYVNSHPQEKDNLIESLFTSAKTVDRESVLSSKSDDVDVDGDYDDYHQTESSLITFEERGKKFLFFDNYDFLLQSQPLYVYTNYSHIEYFLNNEKMDAQSTDELVYLGKHLPGIYELKGVLSTDFMELEKDIHVVLYDEYYGDMYFDIDYVYINEIMAGATVFINDQDSGFTIPPDGDYFGPILVDGSMELHLEIETPFGLAKTNSFFIDGYEISPYFTLSDDQTNDIFETVNTHINEWSMARSDLDVSQVSTATSSHFEFLTNSIDTMTSWDQLYIGYLAKTSFDLDSISLYKNGSSWMLVVEVEEEWYESTYYRGASPSLEEYTDAKQYYLTFDEAANKWLVSDISSAWGFTDDNLKTFTFEVDEAEVAETMKALLAENVEEFQSLMHNFVSSSVDAINYRNFSYVSDLIDPDAEDYKKEVSDYIEYLDSRDITESFITAEVVSVEPEDDDDYFHVSTYEEYIIYYSDDSAILKGFNSEYRVRMTNDGLRVSKLLNTDEVKSEDQ